MGDKTKVRTLIYPPNHPSTHSSIHPLIHSYLSLHH